MKVADLAWPRQAGPLSLRPPTPDDIAQALTWRNSPEVTRWLLLTAVDPQTYTRDWLEDDPDSLGVAADLDAAMARHVDSYSDEWRDVLDDPAKLARFAAFVNDDAPDDDLHYVVERGQRRPATAAERSDPQIEVVDAAFEPVEVGGAAARD